MSEPAFIPQPYPLFAAMVEKAENPLRFEPSLVPIRLVLGWIVQDGLPRPVLDGSPAPIIWRDAISLHESRDQAEEFVKQIEKAARSEIRDHEVKKIFRKLTGNQVDSER